MLIVPECERLSVVPQALGRKPVTSFQWLGDKPSKGLAVLSYGDYTVEPHPSYDPRFRWIVPLSVSGPASFLLFAVWTLPHADSRSYVQPLFEAFEHYRPLLATSETIWAGDFNANCSLDRPRRAHKFRNFVGFLSEHGLRSLYHEQQGCLHGEEPDETFFLYHHAARGLHLDYIFASSGISAFLIQPECWFTCGVGTDERSHAAPL